jgi:3-oxoacyl-[acyl-carrier-protein] synthase II
LMPITVAAFDVMGALSQRVEDPAGACRPFDNDRDGFVMSEGSALVVMETLEHALARGARILAEVIGYGNTNDAYHMAAPHSTGRGAVDAMRAALRKAAAYGETLNDVDYINAHGTATRLNDIGETLAIKQVFGETAYNVRISSTKSMTGHLLGAAGALETIICVKTITTGVVAPTINLHNPDPECDLNYTPNQAVEQDVRVALSNSFGFGGHNACIMLRRYI